MIEDLFDHTCDIYHAVKETVSRGYGLPDSVGEKLVYPDKPDIASQACHFGVKSGQIMVVQQEPQRDLDGRLKLTLPAGTDIRVNDKVVSGTSGYIYTAEIPRNIRDHHVSVMIKREYPQAL